MSINIPVTESVKEVLSKYSDTNKYIVLNPNVAQISASPFYKVYAVEMQFGDKDWYWAGSGNSLTKPALMRICGALSISILSSVRTDNGSNPDLALYSVIGSERMPDGQMRSMSGSGVFDVNDVIGDNFASSKKKRDKGDTGYKGKTDAQLLDAAEAERAKLRRFRGQRAETNAIERMIKAMTGMATSYKKEDIHKTFVALVTAPNMDALFMDPEIRRMAAAQAIGAIGQMYGGTQQQGLGPAPEAQQLPPRAPAGELPPASDASASAQADAAPVNPEEVKIDEWECASPQERTSYITELWTKREHPYGDTQWQKIMSSGARTQARYIVEVLEKCPIKGSEAPSQTDQNEKQSSPPPQENGRWSPSQAQAGRLIAIGGKAGYNPDDLHALIAERYNGISSFNDLTYPQYKELCGDDKDNTPSWLLDNPKTTEDTSNRKEGKEDDLPF